MSSTLRVLSRSSSLAQSMRSEYSISTSADWLSRKARSSLPRFGSLTVHIMSSPRSIAGIDTSRNGSRQSPSVSPTTPASSCPPPIPKLIAMPTSVDT